MPRPEHTTDPFTLSTKSYKPPPTSFLPIVHALDSLTHSPTHSSQLNDPRPQAAIINQMAPPTAKEKLTTFITCFESMKLLIGLTQSEEATLSELRHVGYLYSEAGIAAALEMMREKGQFKGIEGE